MGRDTTTCVNFAFLIILCIKGLVALAPYLNSYLDLLEGMHFYTPDVCTDTLHYLSSDTEDLAFRLEHGLDSEGLRTVMDPVRNRTAITTRRYRAREFVCEYTGERIDRREMDRRFASAPEDDFGYILTFENTILEETYIVDATPESDGRCRLISHSWKKANVDVYPVRYRGQARLIFLATKDIAPGEELWFDYGYERMEPKDVQQFPWLKE